MDTAVQVRFLPRPADLTWAARASLRTRPIACVLGIVLFGVVPVVIAIWKIIDGANMGAPIDWLTVVVMLCLPAAMLFADRVPASLFRKLPSLQGEHIYTLNADGLQFVGPGFQNRVEWSVVTQALWSEDGLLLLSRKWPIVSIPVRALSAGSAEALSSLLKSLQVPAMGRMPGKWET